MKYILKLFLLFIIYLQVLSANETKNITLQLQWKHQFEFAGFYAAKEKGFYKTAGMNIEFKEYDGKSNIVDTVLYGNAHFGLTYSSLIAEYLKGKDVVFLANYFKQSPLVLVTAPSIKTIKDLKNKKVMGVSDDIDSITLKLMLEKFNVYTEDIINIPTTFNLDDFIEKKVDAMSVFTTNEIYQLDQLGIKYNTFNPSLYGHEYYDVNLFSTNKFINQNQELTKKFIEATNKGWEYALKNKEEIINLILTKYNTQNKSKEHLLFEANQIEQLMFAKTEKIGYIDPLRVNLIAQNFIESGFVSKEHISKLDDLIYKSDNKNSIINLTTEEQNFLYDKAFVLQQTDWHPFFIYNKSTKEFEGIGAEIWQSISKMIPIKYTIQLNENFDRSLKNVKNNTNAVIVGTSYTKQRAQYSLFSKPFLSYPIAIATNNKENFIYDLKDLEGKTIAVGKNYSSHKLLLEHYPKIKFVPVNNTLEALELLANNKVYGAADILPSLQNYLHKFAYQNLKISGTSKFNFDLRIMTNIENQNFINIINKAINQISEGDKKSIYNKWMQTVKEIERIDYTPAYIVLFLAILIISFLLGRHKELTNSKYILEQKKQEFETLFENSSDGIAIIKNNQFIKCNQSFLNILKLSCKKDLLNTHPSEISPEYQPDGRESFDKANEMMALAIKQGRHQFEWLHTRIDGEEFWADVILTPISLNQEEVIHVILRDISDKKRQEELIVNQTKMAALGEMIGNISHQWRQPLSVISTSASGLKVQKEMGDVSDNEILSACDIIDDNVQYLSKTIDDFRDYIKGDAKKLNFNLKENIKSFLGFVKGTIKNNEINIVENISKDIQLVGYPSELIQCYINIFNNSKDALSNLEKDKYIFISSSIQDDKVFISFKDNAGGIDENIILKVFEPYFTTKFRSQGTGLGLHMTYELIVNNMKGNIEAHNVSFEYNDQKFKGAELIITLPLVS